MVVPDERYDPEAIYQEADVEQAAAAAEGRRYDAVVAAGICPHDSVVAYRRQAFYPRQEGLRPGQKACNTGVGGCTAVFDSDEDWQAAMRAAMDG